LSLRTERIGQQLRNEIARVLRDVVTDPRVHDVTLTGVDVSPDLSNAIVHWSIFDLSASGTDEPVSDELLGEVESGLESCAGFVRRNLAVSLELRRVPELRFRYDPSLQLGGETLELLQAIHDGKEKKSQ
jgi:ribosome-binding factor A